MRRRDREVTDLCEILSMLNACDTVRIGVNGNGAPYVVPVSFGAEEKDGRIVIYVHGAAAGMKRELLQRDGRICAEADRLLRYEETRHGVTTRYESVIGFGSYVPLTDRDEKIHALELICAHCGYAGYDVSDCGALDHTDVFALVLDSVAGKRNAG